MQQNNFLDFIRRHKVLIIIVSTVAVLLFVASRFSFVTVEVPNANQQNDITYSVSETASNKTSTNTANKTTYRKLVGRGNYSVSVSQNSQNFFALVKTKGFFLSKKVVANLESEKSRTFVGDNPDACMQYSNTVLLSYSCNGLMKTLKVHLPAEGSQSTYAKPIDGSGDTLEGTVRLNGEAFGLIHGVGGERSESPRLISLINASGRVSSAAAYHNEISSSDTYNIGTYKDGFVIHGGNTTGELLYYKSYKSSPERIAITPPKNKKLIRYLFATSKDSVAIAYIDRNKSDVNDAHDGKSSGTTTVLMVQDDKSKEMAVPGTFTDLKPCGTKKLCVLVNQQLRVYDVAGKSAKLLYTLPNVQALGGMNDRLLVVNQDSVIALDVDQQSGTVDYSFGSYTYCGISTDDQGYVLCMINDLNRRVALRFDRTKENTSNIDKKIAGLQKSKAVSVLSIYGNQINVVPNYGAKVYNPSSKVYESDPAVVARMKTQFASDLLSVGIDKNAYKINGI